MTPTLTTATTETSRLVAAQAEAVENAWRKLVRESGLVRDLLNRTPPGEALLRSVLAVAYAQLNYYRMVDLQNKIDENAVPPEECGRRLLEI